MSMNILRRMGSRLREAREFLGWTQEAAAQRLGITREYLSQLETGKRRIPLRLLARVADVFGRPESWFFGSGEPTGSLGLLLRQTEKAPLSDETKKALARFVDLCEEIVSLRRLLGRPVPDLPSYPVTRERLEEQARQAAVAERRRLGLDDDPVPRVADLLEAQGIAVIRLSMPDEVSGAMAYDAEAGVFILVNAEKSPSHQLWTVAHEYGHLLKDRDLGFRLPEVVEEVREAVEDPKRRWAEVFADKFAAHFLLPEETVRRFVEGVFGGRMSRLMLIELRRTFGVSYAALLRRLRELGYLGAPEFARWRQERLAALERDIFGDEAPGKDRLVSRVLWDLVLEAVSRGEITQSYAAEVLGISPMEVQDILYELEEATVGQTRFRRR